MRKNRIPQPVKMGSAVASIAVLACTMTGYMWLDSRGPQAAAAPVERTPVVQSAVQPETETEIYIHAYVNSESGLNIRKAPDIGSEVVGILPFGAGVTGRMEGIWILRICKLAFPEIKQVVCASGDKFLDFERKKLYGSMFGAAICDMESAGILLTCDRNRVPCLLIKSIADGATGGGTEYWNMKDRAAEAALRVLQRVLREI